MMFFFCFCFLLFHGSRNPPPEKKESTSNHHAMLHEAYISISCCSLYLLPLASPVGQVQAAVIPSPCFLSPLPAVESESVLVVLFGVVAGYMTHPASASMRPSPSRRGITHVHTDTFYVRRTYRTACAIDASMPRNLHRPRRQK